MSNSGVSSSDGRLSGAQLALLLVGLLAARLALTLACPIYDDAFITYRYARNLAAGAGLVFNPGAPWEPVLGTTTPGYAVLLAGLQRLGLPAIGASLGVNFLADVVALALICRLLGRATLPCLGAAFMFAAMPSLGRVSAGGMEAPLFACLALAAVVLRDGRRPAASGVCAAVCCTMRPEAVLLVLVLGVLDLREPRRLLRFSVPVLLIGVVYAGALWAVYGTPIPQSIAAKASKHAVNVKAGRLGDVLRLSFCPILPMLPLLPIVIAGAVHDFRRKGAFTPFALFALAMVAAYLAVRPKTWGWYYYVPLTAWAVWFGIGSAVLAERFLPQLAARVRALPAAALGVALAAVGTVVLVVQLRPDRVSEEVYAAMERWVADERIEERGASVLASDIGAIGWFANVTILDSMGLIWPRAVEYSDQLEAIRDQRPDYVFLVAVRARAVPFRAAADLTARYRPVRRFNAVGQEDLEPDPESLPETWVQDYIVYRRVSDG